MDREKRQKKMAEKAEAETEVLNYNLESGVDSELTRT